MWTHCKVLNAPPGGGGNFIPHTWGTVQKIQEALRHESLNLVFMTSPFLRGPWYFYVNIQVEFIFYFAPEQWNHTSNWNLAWIAVGLSTNKIINTFFEGGKNK